MITYANLQDRLDRWSEPRVPGRCQLWLGARDRKGYGYLGWEGHTLKAHRATWECEKGPIPEGLHVLHHCDNPPCRNIEHLWLGTNRDNVDDMVRKGRQPHTAHPGETNGRAKLTEADVLVIRAIPADVPHWVIAAMYGVCENMVGRVCRREAWRHL